ncbi:hypothetical protein BUZ84_06805 [Mammaliicoccus sciuri]|uniref:PH domain-containing protein n=1 Tax=Mammaliicoccus sciuri TaxID=1296 RepID=UPI000D1E682D|nr:PH domain-containing protein [Mammaliicoccus sciuri]PTJ81257.1 hypothetical protein BUZ84_06805 [Mammaliicoccus sciuri]
MRPVIFNPKEALREGEYYASLSRSEKKEYKKLPKEKQIDAYKEFHINKSSGQNLSIDDYNKRVEDMFQHLKDIGVTDLFGTKKEVKTLVQLLKKDETVLYATSGFVDNNTYLIVCTDVRLLFLDKGMIYGLKKFEYPFSKINSVSYKLGIVFGELEVQHGSTSILIKNITKDTVERMSITIQEQIEKNEVKINLNQNQSISAADEIMKFKQLLDDGIISQDEFNKKKNELLNM